MYKGEETEIGKAAAVCKLEWNPGKMNFSALQTRESKEFFTWEIIVEDVVREFCINGKW